MVISRATSPPVVLNSSSLVQSNLANAVATGSLLQLTTTNNNTSTPNILNAAGQQNGVGGVGGGINQQRSSSSLALTSQKQFSENFWGEKINGFDVLCQNLKHSLTSVKDLENFLRESANCEDSYGKVLNKLVSQVNKFSQNGTFNPLWSPLKELNERYASTHVQLVHQLHELIKEIQRYNDELGKKIKKIRENEIQTQNVVQSFQEIQQTLNKTREQYHNLCNEFEKQKRQLDPQQLAQFQQLQQQQVSSSNLLSMQTSAYGGASGNQQQQDLFGSNAFVPNNSNNNQPGGALNSNLSGSNIAASNMMTTSGSMAATGNQSSISASTADRLSSLATSIAVSKVSQLLKLEKKLKQVLEDYKTSVDKYNAIRVDYERKLADSCNHFQYAEETHLKQMRSFIESYSKLMQNTNTTKQHIFNEFQYKFMDQYTVDYLLQLFVDNKRTGIDRPDPAQCLIDQRDLHSQHQQMVSPAPTPIPFASANYNNLINDNESYNLFVGPNYSTQPNNSSSNMQPPPPPSYNQSQASQQAALVSAANDLTDGRGGELNSTFSAPGLKGSSGPGAIPAIGGVVSGGSGSRGTPVFFSSSNLDNSALSPYGQLSGTYQNSSLNPPPSSAASTGLAGTSSPISHLTSHSQPPVPSQTAAQQSLNATITSNTSENMKRNDSKGLNIFNVDFLGRNRNKEKKAKEKAAAAAAAAASANDTILSAGSGKPSKLSSKGKKTSKQAISTSALPTPGSGGQMTGTSGQYESLNSSNFMAAGGHSINSNRDSSSINSEDSNDPQRQAAAAGAVHTNHLDHHHHHHHHPASRDSAMSPTNMMNGGGNMPAVPGPGAGGSVTARSISSITGSLSLDLLDQLKISGNGGNGNGNGAASDIDSEGFSIRPDSSVDLRRRRNKLNGSGVKNKDNEDMNNFYGSSSTDSDSDDSDSEDGENGGPMKVMLKIKPKSEVVDDKQQNNAEVLREISKNLQLKPTLLQGGGLQLGGAGGAKNAVGKKRTYYYNYGTANPDQAVSGYSTSNLFSPSDLMNSSTAGGGKSTSDDGGLMQRSVSVGSVVNTNAANRNSVSLFGDIDFAATPLQVAAANKTATTTSTAAPVNGTSDSSAKSNSINLSANLLDLDFLSPVTPAVAPTMATTTAFTNSAAAAAAAPSALPISMSLSKINENNSLYNIDEDKEVESSFQYNSATATAIKRNSHNSPALPTSNSTNSIITANLTSTTTTTMTTSNSASAAVNNFSANATAAGAGAANLANSGRFTPACFPGRTTPDFRHTTSLFEQQGIRASIVSPLTVNGAGSEIIPIAVAFNETIHAYFKMGGDTTKFKVKCFGCMKISFPFAILKLLAVELPQLSFRLNNLQIANQDLKINNQLIQITSKPLTPTTTTSSQQNGGSIDPLLFQFITPNLIRELKEQHQQNKMAAFFNFELLKYEFKYTNTPLVLNAVWSHNQDENTIELNLDYIHTFRKQLSQVNFMIVMPMVPNAISGAPTASSPILQSPTTPKTSVTYRVALIKSEPKAFVQENDNRLQILWQMPSINANGRLVAKFQVTSLSRSTPSDAAAASVESSPAAALPPNISCPLEQFYQPVYVKFHIDNDTLSQVKFDIMSPNYKLSLLKERIETGKYFCNYDQQVTQAVQQQQQLVKLSTSSSQDSSMTARPLSTSQSMESSKDITVENLTNGESSSADQQQQAAPPKKPFIPAGSINSHIGSSVDILLNC